MAVGPDVATDISGVAMLICVVVVERELIQKEMVECSFVSKAGGEGEAAEKFLSQPSPQGCEIRFGIIA